MNIISEVRQGLDKSNFDVKPGLPETIHDLRGQETHFNLDDNGFQVVQHLLQTTVFGKETITTQYLPAIESLLKSVEPGIEVHIFDWTHGPERPNALLEARSSGARDQSPYAAKKRAINAHGDDPSAIEGNRTRIIKSDLALAVIGAPIANRRSVWRPITHPIENYPLALCDGSTVPPEMPLRVDHVRKYYVGESLYPLQSPKYRWHYLNRETRDEVLLFKMFDSRESVAAKCEFSRYWHGLPA
ncbi:hypothetical protein LCI18_002655 [Fusarium solani-melongenae]|uniref:Uncharacterized protein n=1 Tax=Fusarium solani subsp. cucurbitae TaxID=2747967 RepID=A0ACD3YS47_FUSSC|nr:hypothetical protein LCI18_002655 [Fusarium solani-melongenae]